MPFLNPLFLLALAAAAAPIALHLLNRRNPKPFPFSSLRYLRAAVAQTRKSRRLTQLLVLLLRMAVLALLALAFARPRLRSATWLPDGPRTVILVIDGSASMRCRGAGDSNYNRARQWALQLISELRDQDKVALVITGTSPSRVVFPAISNHSLVRQAIRETPCGFGSTQPLSDLDAVVRDVLENHANESLEIHYFSDFQASTWNRRDVKPLAGRLADGKIRLFLNRVESAATGNAWIRNVTLSPPAILGQGLVTADVRLESAVAAAGNSVLRLSMQGEEAVQRGVVLSDGSQRERLAAKVPDGADFALGRVALDPDPYLEDNTWFFALERRDQISVLLVNGGPAPRPAAADTFYLKHALNPQRLSSPLIRGHTVNWSELSAIDLQRFQTVLVANPPPVAAATALKLELYAESGGIVVLYPGARAAPTAVLQNFKTLQGVTAKPQSFPQTQRFKTLRSDASLDLERRVLGILPGAPAFTGSQRLLLRGGEAFDSVFQMDSGTALFLRRAHGRGELWVAAVAASRDWSEWPMHPAFVVFHQLLIRDSFQRRLRTTTIEVGAAAEVAWAGSETELPATLQAPDGTSARLTLTRRQGNADFVIQEFPQPGHYRLVLEAAAPETRYVAVNVPQVESPLAPVSMPELAAEFAPLEIQQAADFEAQRDILANMTYGHALWPYLLLLAFLVAVAEELFANFRSWQKGSPTTLKQILRRQHP